MYFVFNLDKWNDNIDSFLSFLTTKYKKRNRIYLHICSMIKNLQTEQNSNISLQIISTLSHFPFRSIRSKKRKKEREKNQKKNCLASQYECLFPWQRNFPSQRNPSRQRKLIPPLSRFEPLSFNSFPFPLSLPRWTRLEPRGVRAEPGPRTQLPRPFSRRVHATPRATASPPLRKSPGRMRSRPAKWIFNQPGPRNSRLTPN